MSTDQTAVMAGQQTPVQEVDLVKIVTQESDQVVEKFSSAVHYIWNPSHDIRVVGPEGLSFRLGKGRNYYGLGLPREGLEDYLQRGGDRLLRCSMYGLWNIDYSESIANTGDFTSVEARGKDVIRQEMIRLVDRRQYASTCADDMFQRYHETHGLQILSPLTGMDGAQAEIARELLKIVQPYGYPLTSPRQKKREDDKQTLIHDLTHTAMMRIEGAGFDEGLNKTAKALRIVMRNGVMAAIKEKEREWDELNKSMSDAKLGRPGKTIPTDYDRELAFLLGEPTPTSVVRPPEAADSAGSEAALNRLADLITQRAAPGALNADDTRELLAEMQEERLAAKAEREALALERQELAAERQALALAQAEAGAEAGKKKK